MYNVIVLIILFFATGFIGTVQAEVTCNQSWQNGSVFLSARTSPTEPTILYQVLRDGGSPIPLGSPLFYNPASPYFSPNGQDSLLYFDADTGTRHFIFALCADGNAFQLTSDPYGGGVDRNPSVSINKKHLLFQTNRSGPSLEYVLADKGLEQGPGYGSPFPVFVPIAWSISNPDAVWYWKDNTTLAEYDLTRFSDTGKTIAPGVTYRSPIVISPDGSLLALVKPGSAVAVYNFKGTQQIEFASVKGRNPSWSDNETLVFADVYDSSVFYRANVSTGAITPIKMPGLQIISLYAVPKSNWLASVECLFTGMEKGYAGLLSPANSSLSGYSNYLYRSYGQTNAILAIDRVNNHLNYQGPDKILQDIGPLAKWLPSMGCPQPVSPPPLAECMFNWAEKNYPGLFSPSGSSTVDSGVSNYRYYSATRAYLQLSMDDNHLYYQGPDGAKQDEGAIAKWLSQAGCQ